MKTTTNITIPFKWSRVVDLFISACEGGSNYWCKELTPRGRHKDHYEAMLGGFTLIELEDDKRHEVTPEMIQTALEQFPITQPRAFADWVAENDDAETADIFLQLCVFGEPIYG